MRFCVKYLTIMTLALLVSACSQNTKAPVNESKPIGMANPASVYCQQVGGPLEMVQTDAGTVGYCHLPAGEKIEEWTLFHHNKK